MEEREFRPIAPGAEVYDREGHKLGTVAHVYERAAPGATTRGVTGYIEVVTGLLGRLVQHGRSNLVDHATRGRPV